ncbi:MAG TPA: SPW repeat protein [Ensifer sp.]|nr:SPW repeat protein [Ensifer sp.]
MENRHWQDWLTGVAGLWLAISPWVMPYISADGMVNAMITWTFFLTGVVVVLIAAAAVSAFSEWQENAGIVLGIWIAISPWILGFSGFPFATVNAVVCGSLIFVLAAWTIFDIHRMGRA